MMLQGKLNEITGETRRCYSGNDSVVQGKLNRDTGETKQCYREN